MPKTFPRLPRPGISLFGILTSAFVLCLLHLQFVNCNPGPKGNSSQDYLAKLKDDLFGDKKYDNKKRPVLNFKDGIDISLYLVILHIYNLDEVTGTLQVNGWAEMSWLDGHLKWNASDYGGLDFIDVPDRMVWKPDLSILNSVESGVLLSDTSRTQIFVNHDGMITWVPPFFSKTSCQLDHRSFPFDEQTCRLEVGSWAYPATYLMLQKPYEVHPEQALIKTFYVENAMWEFVSETSVTKNMSFECCPEDPFMMQESILLLRRQSPFYKFLYVIPSIMSMILTLAVFWVPVGLSGEKLTLGAIVIFVQMALIMALSLSIPKGGKYVPRIVLFCGNSLIMTTISLLISVTVTKMSRLTSYTPLPSTVKNVLAGPIGRALFLGTGAFQADSTSVMGVRKLENETCENGASNVAAKPSAFSDWILLATAIDHFCFFIFTFVFAILLVASFAV